MDPTLASVATTGTNWDAVGAIATVAASAVAIFALPITAYTVIKQKKSQDFGALRQFAIDIRDAEDRLTKVKVSSDDFEFVFVDYLNLLEVSAAGINHNLLEKIAENVVKDRLVNDIAMMSGNEVYAPHIKAALTSRTTFQELRRFHLRFKSEIAQTIRERRQLRAIVASSTVPA